jgi:uncharacterized membrane protein YdbT with pleckstrin-like domain
MGYIENSLGANEVLIARARFHWLHYAAAWLVLIAFLAAALLCYGLYRTIWPAAAFVAAGLLGFLAMLVPIWTTEIGVTNQRVIVKRGFLARRTDEIELWAIEEANLEQSVPGRLLGYGRINVQGTGDDALEIPVIGHPVRFRKAIQDAIGQAAQPPGTPTPRAHGKP